MASGAPPRPASRSPAPPSARPSGGPTGRGMHALEVRTGQDGLASRRDGRTVSSGPRPARLAESQVVTRGRGPGRRGHTAGGAMALDGRRSG
ncbi:uncharacterized protein LOC114673764 [Macaca mulatta]